MKKKAAAHAAANCPTRRSVAATTKYSPRLPHYSSVLAFPFARPPRRPSQAAGGPQVGRGDAVGAGVVAGVAVRDAGRAVLEQPLEGRVVEGVQELPEVLAPRLLGQILAIDVHHLLQQLHVPAAVPGGRERLGVLPSDARLTKGLPPEGLGALDQQLDVEGHGAVDAPVLCHRLGGGGVEGLERGLGVDDVHHLRHHLLPEVGVQLPAHRPPAGLLHDRVVRAAGADGALLPLVDQDVQQQAALAHVRAQVGVGVADRVLLAAHVLARRVVQAVVDGAALAALARLGHRRALGHARQPAVDGRLQVDHLHLVRESKLGRVVEAGLSGVVRAAVVHHEDAPGDRGGVLGQPRQLVHLGPEEVLPVGVLGLGQKPPGLSVHSKRACEMNLLATHSIDNGLGHRQDDRQVCEILPLRLLSDKPFTKGFQSCPFRAHFQNQISRASDHQFILWDC
mmetsp:Transcript_19380/g.32149  ORF Transcript_19380/g.32149 Transcript_19380/m.32149 type:complete len:452 (-) Transcript_19380:194-1549(-)